MSKKFSVKTGKKFVKAKNFISVFSTQVLEIAKSQAESIAKEFAESVKKIIKKQLYKWKPLNERHLAKKKSMGLDERILIATKEYVESIKAIPKKILGVTTSWSVGPGAKGKVHKVTKGKEKSKRILMRTLSRWLEFGNKRMPARPHWRPAWSAFLRKKKLTSRRIIKKVTKEVKKKTLFGGHMNIPKLKKKMFSIGRFKR